MGALRIAFARAAARAGVRGSVAVSMYGWLLLPKRAA